MFCYEQNLNGRVSGERDIDKRERDLYYRQRNLQEGIGKCYCSGQEGQEIGE